MTGGARDVSRLLRFYPLPSGTKRWGDLGDLGQGFQHFERVVRPRHTASDRSIGLCRRVFSTGADYSSRSGRNFPNSFDALVALLAFCENTLWFSLFALCFQS
jgi:hypothetical protein